MMFLDTVDPPADYDENPAPYLARWRDAAPIHYLAKHDLWLATSYDMISRLLRDERIAPGPKYSFLAHSREFRTTVARELRAFFGPSGDAFTDEAVRYAVADAFRCVQKPGEVDLIREIARPIPISVMGRLMGMSPNDCLRLQPLTEALVDGYEASDRPNANVASKALLDAFFMQHLVKMRRSEPSYLMSILLKAGEQYEIPDPVMADLCTRTLTAGSGTTAAWIGNILVRMLCTAHPGSNSLPCENDLKMFTEELVRVETPLLGIKRCAASDIDIDGASIRQGQTVVLLIAAGNRDPAQFPNPDEIDCNRPAARSFTFGMGSHHCLGKPLACKEITTMLTHLRSCMARMEVLEPPARKVGWLTHQAESLRVRVSPQPV